MRIALASIHPRLLSGQIEQLVGLTQVLENLGHEVTLVSPFPSEQLLGPLRFRQAGNPQRIFLDQPSRIAHVLGDLVRVAPHMDLIQLNLPTPAFSILGDLLQLAVRVPVVVGYESHLMDTRMLLQRGYWRQACQFYLPRLLINNRLVARLTWHHARGYAVNSQYQKEELVQLGAEAGDIRVLPTVLPRDKRARASAEMRSLFPPGRIMTYIGHYNHVKGVDVLLRAFQILAPCFPDLYLALAWSGVGSARPLAPLLTHAALDRRVYPLGQIEVSDLLGASDVVVLPYRMTAGQAAFPAVLAEALAANAPVVTSDLPLLRELTADGKRALLVPPDNPAALATGIGRVLNETELVRQMSRAQQQWVQQISPLNVAREYERFYKQVIAHQYLRQFL